MDYGSAGVTKLEYGTYLCAALAWLLNTQRDAVGLMAFDSEVVAHVPPSVRPGHLRTPPRGAANACSPARARTWPSR